MAKKSLPERLIDMTFSFIYFLVSRYNRWINYGDFQRQHLTIDFDGKNTKIKWYEHWELVEIVEEKLEALEVGKDPYKYITSALEIARGCNFIIFECLDDFKYVQFWIGDKNIKTSFYPGLHEDREMVSYALSGALSRLGVNLQASDPNAHYKYYYTVHKSNIANNLLNEEITANFGRNIDMVTNFTIIVLRDILNQDLRLLRCKVG